MKHCGFRWANNVLGEFFSQGDMEKEVDGRDPFGVTFITSIIMVNGIEENLSSVRVIGHLGNGREFTWFEWHDLVPWIT